MSAILLPGYDAGEMSLCSNVSYLMLAMFVERVIFVDGTRVSAEIRLSRHRLRSDSATRDSFVNPVTGS